MTIALSYYIVQLPHISIFLFQMEEGDAWTKTIEATAHYESLPRHDS